MEEGEALTPFQAWFKSQMKYKTQGELAKATGLTEAYISFYLRGKKQPTKEHCKALFEFTGLECFRPENNVDKVKEKKMVEITKGDDKLGDQLPLHTQLRNWFKSQTKWKTKKEFADDVGIKYKTLEDYFYKGSRPGKENRQKLYEVTGIEILKEETEINKKEKLKTLPDSSKIEREPKEVEIFTDMVDGIIELQKISSNLNERLNDLTEIYEKCIINKLPHSKEDSSIEERVEIVKELVYALNRELEFFKKGSPESREIFGNSVYAPDVGYIMALFKALFDEDKFQTWLLMSSYELKRR